MSMRNAQQLDEGELLWNVLQEAFGIAADQRQARGHFAAPPVVGEMILEKALFVRRMTEAPGSFRDIRQMRAAAIDLAALAIRMAAEVCTEEKGRK